MKCTFYPSIVLSIIFSFLILNCGETESPEFISLVHPKKEPLETSNVNAFINQLNSLSENKRDSVLKVFF